MRDKSLAVNREEQQSYWAMHVQRWRESNMKQEAYCAQVGIKYSSFVYWKSALTPKEKLETKSSFVPVKIEANEKTVTTQSQAIQIKLTTGHVVYLPVTMDPKQIASLIYSLSTSHA